MKITRIHNTSLQMKKIRVAAYARVSADEADNIESLSAQISYYSKLIQANPSWEYAGVYSDEGITGTRLDRPGFTELLQEAESGNINIILTKSISRFSRNTVDLLQTVRHLKDIGVSVQFNRENIDTMTESGELMLTLLSSFAEEEAYSVSQNVRWAFKKKFESGYGIDVHLYGYRFDGHEFHIKEDEAKIIRRIFKEYLDGCSPDQIAKELTQEGYTSRNHATRFTYAAVCTILRQEKYTGNSIFQKYYTPDFLSHKQKRNKGEQPRYYAEGVRPPIIQQEIFDKAQAEIERRKALGFRANRNHGFSIFTQCLVCSSCGAFYKKKNGKSAGKRLYHYWSCKTKVEQGMKTCGSCNVPDIVLNQLTADVLSSEIVDDELFEEKIDHIEVSPYTLTFIMKDGSSEVRHWEPKDNGTKGGRTKSV